MAINIIYKVVPRELWHKAEDVGVFSGAPVDHADGFIHFSNQQQLAETLAKHFAGQDDLLLVGVDANQFGDELKWERSRNDELFPHLYGELVTSTAIFVQDLPLDKNGLHVIPSSDE